MNKMLGKRKDKSRFIFIRYYVGQLRVDDNGKAKDIEDFDDLDDVDSDDEGISRVSNHSDFSRVKMNHNRDPRKQTEIDIN